MAGAVGVDRGLVSILLGLTAVTGVVDAVSFLALGLFTANMTGNVVLLGFAVAGVPGLSVPRSATALAMFFAGGFAGGRIAAWMRSGPLHRWTGLAFGLEAALLLTAMVLAAGHYSVRPVDSIHLYVIIGLTALAMGLRGVTVRQLGIAEVSTVVLTLTIADLARGWAAGAARDPRWATRIASVATMFAGAALGALLARESLVLPFAVSGIASGVCATAAFLALRGRPATPSGPPAAG